MISQARVKELFDYNEYTGVFIRKIPASNSKPGNIAGTPKGNGYITISIDNKRYLAHRLAWLFMYGYIHGNIIDHINGDRSDNRISNLRESNASLNAQNIKSIIKNNSTGLLGVCFVKRLKKNNFKASITIDRKSIHLGYFETAEEASKAYLVAKRKLHEACTL